MFLLCVAANQKTSFNSIDKWIDEIKSVEDEKPIILCLTKLDMAKSVNHDQMVHI